MVNTLPLPEVTVHLKETLDVLSDPELLSQIAESRTFYQTARKGLSFKEVFSEPLTPKKRRRTA